MTHEEKLTWMALWASKNRVTLDLEGSVGFGRDCVGITVDSTYPDYEWYDKDWNEVSGNDVWIPENAYHKHPCVAVLGRGEESESQLYEWLKWFDDNGYTVESGYKDPPDTGWNNFDLLMNNHRYYRMVKR